MENGLRRGMEAQKALVNSSRLYRTLRPELRLELMFSQMGHFQRHVGYSFSLMFFAAAALSLPQLDRGLLPKVQRKQKAILGEGRGGRAAAPGSLHSPLAKRCPRYLLTGLGHVSMCRQGQGYVTLDHCPDTAHLPRHSPC